MLIVSGLFLSCVLACGQEGETQAVAADNSNGHEKETKSDMVTHHGDHVMELESGETALIVQEGSVARYLVTEQLARLKLPNDAIGETKVVRGAIVLDASGIIDRERSEIAVDLRTLVSDEPRRDQFLSRNVLESRKFPFARMSFDELIGLPWPLPKNGSSSFRVSGSATVHGKTELLTWSVRSDFSDGIITALAETEFKFEKFGMSVPSLVFIVSVEDKIRLQVELILQVRTVP